MTLKTLAAAALAAMLSLSPAAALAEDASATLLQMLDGYCDRGGGVAAFAQAAARRDGYTPASPTEAANLRTGADIDDFVALSRTIEGHRYFLVTGHTPVPETPLVQSICAVGVEPGVRSETIVAAIRAWVGRPPEQSSDTSVLFAYAIDAQGARTDLPEGPQPMVAMFEAGRARSIVIVIDNGVTDGILYSVPRIEHRM